MAFKKGDVKPAGSGRQKGTKNKKTLLTVEQILLENDVNPIQKLIEIALGGECSYSEEISCWKEIAKYTYSQKKAVEREDIDDTTAVPPVINIVLDKKDG